MSARGRNLFHEIGCAACHAPQVLPVDSSGVQARTASLAELFDIHCRWITWPINIRSMLWLNFCVIR